MSSEESDELRSEREDASTVRAIKRRFGTAERAGIAALLAVGALFAGTRTAGAIHLSHQKQAMQAEVSRASTGIPAEDIALPDRIAAWTTALANDPWQGDRLSGRLATPKDAASYFAQTGVYLRMASTMAVNEPSVHIAAMTSAKDAFASCLFVDLRAPDAEQKTDFVPCDPDTGCAGDSTGNLYNLRELDRGLSVISAQFRTDIDDGDPHALAVMSGELSWRVKDELPRSAKIAAQASYVMVVVDEVPKGFPLPWYATSLQAVQTTPHATRVAVFDAHTGEAMLRVQLDADRAVAGSPNQDVGRQEQSCGLGLDVAEWMHRGVATR